MSNDITPVAPVVPVDNDKLGAYLQRPDVAAKIEEVLGDGKREFVTAMIALGAATPALAECTNSSLLMACMTAAALKLPVSGNLGHAHIVPYKNNKKKVTEAQFQMGWKGFVQLAMRSGQFKTINATDVREGELAEQDRLSGQIIFDWQDERKGKVIGYAAYFKLNNGFEKTLYMTVEELEAHAQKYSASYRNGYKSMWKDDFDAMAKKTVIKLLLASYAPLSVDAPLARAISEDQKVDGEYLDNKITFSVENRE